MDAEELTGKPGKVVHEPFQDLGVRAGVQIQSGYIRPHLKKKKKLTRSEEQLISGSSCFREKFSSI